MYICTCTSWQRDYLSVGISSNFTHQVHVSEMLIHLPNMVTLKTSSMDPIELLITNKYRPSSLRVEFVIVKLRE